VSKTRTVLMLLENRPAPSDARVWPEALALRDAGFNVCVISPKGATKHREPYACIDGVHVYRFSMPTGTSPITYVVEYGTALLMMCRLSLKVWWRHRFAVIHAANPPDIFFPIAWFYRLFGVRFVFDQHDLAPETFQSRFQGSIPSALAGLLRHLLLFCERRTYRAADLVVVTNESFRKIALERGGCPADDVVIVRNGPDLNRLRPVDPEPELKMGRRYLLAYVGEMAAQDGVELAIHALDILVHRHGRQDVGLVLVGDGSSLPDLRSLAHELRLDDCVTFTGWVSIKDVARYLSVADIGLSPEPRDAMNDQSTMIKIMEYMALGKPIVAFDLKETRFSAQEAALYATPNNLEDFALKIAETLDDKDLRRRMGAFGRKRVEDVLSWNHSREQLLQAYGRLFQHGPAASETHASGRDWDS
jgi:glycosyltransferase involved in cell wall biosynthesis